MFKAYNYCSNCRSCDFWEDPIFNKPYHCERNDKTVYVGEIGRNLDTKEITALQIMFEQERRIRLVKRTKQLEKMRKVKRKEERKKKKKEVYTDYDPPAPSTIFCRLFNIPFSVFKYNRSRGFYDSRLDNIEDNLNKGNYICANCTYRAEDKCRRKSMKVDKNAICKSYRPRHFKRTARKKKGK